VLKEWGTFGVPSCGHKPSYQRQTLWGFRIIVRHQRSPFGSSRKASLLSNCGSVVFAKFVDLNQLKAHLYDTTITPVERVEN
jgi:hypothetical protein